MDWDKLRLFYIVADSGSFTTASRRLNMSQSALSRQIKSLEDSLDTSLFTRHARGIVLTSEGEQLFETATNVYQKIENTRESLRDTSEKPNGRLRVTTTVTFGANWLTPRLNDFLKEYPGIHLQLLLSDNDMDLAAGDADVAIRFHQPEQADLIQKRLTPVYHNIYASPEYLTLRGVPETAEDLNNHDLIVYGDIAPAEIKNVNWILARGAGSIKRRPLLTVNSMFGVLEAVRKGMGIAALPDYLATQDPNIMRILPNVEGPVFEAYFVYTKEMRGSPRIAAFREFLERKIDEASKQSLNYDHNV